jgi:N-dimethylarginine dimethylaminohydrolase
MAGPRFLMCPPDHYSVAYTINPWMEPKTWRQSEGKWAIRATREWLALRATLTELGASIEEVRPERNVPDLVFTANSAVVMDGKALLARFKHPERQREQPHYAAAFRRMAGAGQLDSVIEPPNGIIFEGAGDCIWDKGRGMFWTGAGPRSQPCAADLVEDTFGLPAICLELADPRFYHLDTAFSLLPKGEVMYFPEGLSASAQRALMDRVAPDDRIEVTEEDACRLAINGVSLGNTIVLSACSEPLARMLAERGYRVILQPLSAFLLSGGAAYCLTLRTDLRSH